MGNLRIPEPTPCPEAVLQAQTKQMINHRGAEFHAIMESVTNNFKTLFQTKNDLFVLTGAGTRGLESAIVNLFSPCDQILSVKTTLNPL